MSLQHRTGTSTPCPGDGTAAPSLACMGRRIELEIVVRDGPPIDSSNQHFRGNNEAAKPLSDAIRVRSHHILFALRSATPSQG